MVVVTTRGCGSPSGVVGPAATVVVVVALMDDVRWASTTRAAKRSVSVLISASALLYDPAMMRLRPNQAWNAWMAWMGSNAVGVVDVDTAEDDDEEPPVIAAVAVVVVVVVVVEEDTVVAVTVVDVIEGVDVELLVPSEDEDEEWCS